MRYGFESGTEGWTGVNVADGPWAVTEWELVGRPVIEGRHHAVA
jgi:Mannanase, galactose-binding domain-like